MTNVLHFVCSEQKKLWFNCHVILWPTIDHCCSNKANVADIFPAFYITPIGFNCVWNILSSMLKSSGIVVYVCLSEWGGLFTGSRLVAALCGTNYQIYSFIFLSNLSAPLTVISMTESASCIIPK